MVVHLDVRREHEDCHVRELPPDHACRFEAFRGVCRRHPDVDDDEVRLLLADELKKLRCVAGLADHLEPVLFEQARHALTEEDVVIGQRNADCGSSRGFMRRVSHRASSWPSIGILARIDVPFPGVLVISSVPPSDSIRSWRPMSPDP